MNEPVTPRSYEERRQDFILAVALLGGQRETAEQLKIAERTMRGLVSGERHIHDGYMRDISALLIEHAASCRELTKRTDPLFSANRVPPPVIGRPVKEPANG